MACGARFINIYMCYFRGERGTNVPNTNVLFELASYIIISVIDNLESLVARHH